MLQITKLDLRAMQSSSISDINLVLDSVQLCNSSHILSQDYLLLNFLEIVDSS